MTTIDSSTLFGYLSIASWLGAQFPQTITNYRLKSVEGLALTFLFNWFMGDGCNLIGCILTHQLPFQTYLATYFVFVDSVLLFQYFYYGEKKKKTKVVKSALDIEEQDVDEDTSPLLGRDRTDSLSRSYSSIPAQGFSRGRHSAPVSRFNTIERLVANVASAAERMNDQPRENRKSLSEAPFSDEVDEEATGAMLASIYSDRSVDSNTRRSKHKQVSWTPHLQQVERGRSTTEVPRRQQGQNVGTAIPPSGDPPSYSRSRPRQSSLRNAASTTSIVFMGVWTLFGLRTYQHGIPAPFSVSPLPSPHGKVLQPLPDTLNLNQPSSLSSVYAFTSQPLLPRPLLFVTSPYQGASIGTMSANVDGPLTPQPPEAPRVDKERMIGRISAWICTTFYLTCRMPQIWKNYLRKSCKGLSPFLFIFAFLGNTFYVMSIITSPEASGPGATAFLLESLPYLVGSGGTLSFDVIILTQAYIYRGRKPRRLTPPLVNSARSFSSLAVAPRSTSRSRTRERSISTISLG